MPITLTPGLIEVKQAAWTLQSLVRDLDEESKELLNSQGLFGSFRKKHITNSCFRLIIGINRIAQGLPPEASGSLLKKPPEAS